MYHLPLTTDKLQLITDAASSVDVVIPFADYPTAGGDPTPGLQCTAITTATTTDILGSPSSGFVRRPTAVHCRNKHATTPVNVTFVVNRNGILFEPARELLNAGDSINLDEGVGYFRRYSSTSIKLIRTLTADATGGNVNTAQPFFPASGAVTVAAATTYEMRAFFALTRTAGTTSHDTRLLFGGTATLSGIQYRAFVNTGDVETNIAANGTTSRVATATVVKVASTSATEAISVFLVGKVRVNLAGTFIPQFQYSAAPGGAPTIRSDSWFLMEPWGLNTFTAQGTWA